MDYFELLNVAGTETLASQSKDGGSHEFHAPYSAQYD
jgi:hypothetical protein